MKRYWVDSECGPCECNQEGPLPAGTGTFVYKADDVAALLRRAEEAERRVGELEGALSDMRFAYVNKDGEFPHSFETEALALAEKYLGSLPTPPKGGE